MKESLNDVRISDLSAEIHERVVILEKAMANVNHGQGVSCRSSNSQSVRLLCTLTVYMRSQIGFKIGGTVIDRRMLTKIGTQVGVLVSTALPIVLATSVSPQQGLTANTPCAMTADQTALMRGCGQALRATFADSTCRYNTSYTIEL